MGSPHSICFDIPPCSRGGSCRRFADAVFSGSTDGKHSAAHNQRRRLLRRPSVGRYKAFTLLLGNSQKWIDSDIERIAHRYLSWMAVCRGAAAFGFSFSKCSTLCKHQVLATADRVSDCL